MELTYSQLSQSILKIVQYKAGEIDSYTADITDENYLELLTIIGEEYWLDNPATITTILDMFLEDKDIHINKYGEITGCEDDSAETISSVRRGFISVYKDVVMSIRRMRRKC